MDYAVIFNPAAGTARSRRQRAKLVRALRAQELCFELFATEHPGHAVELAARSAERADAVVAAGGDGTVQEVARGLLQSTDTVPLGVVPMGTGNDFVKAIGVPAEMAAAVQMLSEAQPVAVDCGQIRWTAQEGATGQGLFINALGLGFDAQVAANVAAYKRFRGTAAYLASVFRTLRSWEAPTVQIASDGESCYDGPCLLATIGNGICSGGGFYLTPHAAPDDGVLDLCVIESVRPWRVCQLILPVLRGRHEAAPEVHTRRLTTCVVETDVPVPIHADGEVLSRSVRQVEVDVLEGGLTVLAPPRSRTD